MAKVANLVNCTGITLKVPGLEEPLKPDGTATIHRGEYPVGKFNGDIDVRLEDYNVTGLPTPKENTLILTNLDVARYIHATGARNDVVGADYKKPQKGKSSTEPVELLSVLGLRSHKVKAFFSPVGGG